MRLILVRHPPPVVAPGLCYGRTDLPVAADQLQGVADALAATLPKNVPLFSSPLQRCTALAQRLPCASYTLDARLAEIDFGAWEMRAWDTIARAEIDAWNADLAHYRPGGGESVAQVAARVIAFDADLARLQSDCVIVVCHAGTMRLLASCGAGLSPAATAVRAARAPHAIAYGATLTLER